MLFTNFASGELSPQLNGRIDIQQYYQGVAKMENFEIVPTGGINRRVGSRRLAQITANSRIIPYILDKNHVFIFQLFAGVLNIWSLNSDDTFTILQTLYVDYGSLAEIKEIHYAQNYDTIILVHRSYRPVIIKYDFATHQFSLSNMEFDFYPDVEVDDDFDFIMLPTTGLPVCIYTPTSTMGYQFTYTGTSGSVTKTYPVGIKDVYCVYSGHLYKYTTNGWQISGTDADINTDIFTTESNYPGCVAFYNNRLWFASTNSNPQKVWASATPDTDNTQYNDFATYKKYITVEKIIKDPDLHLFTCDLKVANINTGSGRTTLINVSQNFTTAGVLSNDITDYYCSGDIIPVGTRVLSCTADTIVIDTADISIDTDQNNLTLTIQLWRSASTNSADDYTYAIANNNIVTADCSLNFELASDENDMIKFIASNKFLAIGTESTIWSVPSSINATNIAAVMQGRYGSDDAQGLTLGQATIYLAQGRKGIREFYYDSSSEAFQTNNIALLASQMLTESAAVDFDYITNPYNRLLVTRADGQIVSLLYDKNNGVMGWNRNKRLYGEYKSVAVTRGEDENDYTFVVVEDMGNYYIEMIDPGQKIYLDSWQIYSYATAIQYRPGAILWNSTTDQTCEINDIPSDFIKDGDVVYIGYPFKSYIKSMPCVANDPTGRKRITDLIIRFLDSYMPTLSINNLPDEHFTTVNQVPYSGIAQITYPGQTERDIHFEIYDQSVHPVTILNVNANLA